MRSKVANDTTQEQLEFITENKTLIRRSWQAYWPAKHVGFKEVRMIGFSAVNSTCLMNKDISAVVFCHLKKKPRKLPYVF